MRRLAAIVIGLLVAWLGVLEPATPPGAMDNVAAAIAYGSHGYSADFAVAALERGPVLVRASGTSYDAVGLWSDGSSARAEPAAALHAYAYAYDDTARVVRVRDCCTDR